MTTEGKAVPLQSGVAQRDPGS